MRYSPEGLRSSSSTPSCSAAFRAFQTITGTGTCLCQPGWEGALCESYGSNLVALNLQKVGLEDTLIPIELNSSFGESLPLPCARACPRCMPWHPTLHNGSTQWRFAHRPALAELHSLSPAGITAARIETLPLRGQLYQTPDGGLTRGDPITAPGTYVNLTAVRTLPCELLPAFLASAALLPCLPSLRSPRLACFPSSRILNQLPMPCRFLPSL